MGSLMAIVGVALVFAILALLGPVGLVFVMMAGVVTIIKSALKLFRKNP